MTDAECREVREGLIAAVVGAGIDDFAVRWLMNRISADPDALESVIQQSLSAPDRLGVLNALGLMDERAQPMLDSVASLTAEAVGTPFAAVSFLDEHRQFLAGCNVAPTAAQRSRPVGLSICKFTVTSGIPFIVDDATAHPLLGDHPAVISGEIRAYAGIPLFSDEDRAVGTLFIWDTSRRAWTNSEIMILQDMADLASAKIFGRAI